MAKKKVASPVRTDNRRRTIAGAEKSLEEAREMYMVFVERQSSIDTLCEQQIASWTKLRASNKSINGR